MDTQNTHVKKRYESDGQKASVGPSREGFKEWLSSGNARKLSPSLCVSCLDRVSEYVRKKGISRMRLWDVDGEAQYRPVYHHILNARLFRITDAGTYKSFIVAGQLYLEYLQQKPWLSTSTEEASSISESVTAPAFVSGGCQSSGGHRKSIDPEEVIAWLVTQPNAHGTPYLENVVRQYISGLRSAPKKLTGLSLSPVDVFQYTTPDALKSLWAHFRSAPNYVQVNSDTSGALSAGMSCLLRYLEYMSSDVDGDENVCPERPLAGAQHTSLEVMISATLKKRFGYGFGIDSPIELLRFRRFFSEDFGDNLLLDDAELTKAILSLGILFGGKLYMVDPEVIARIGSEIRAAVQEGTELLFYKTIYEMNEHWLLSGSVISEDMLKSIIMQMFPRFVHKKNYFAPEVRSGNELVKIERELLRVWGEDEALHYEQLAERLRYVPLDKIKYALAHSSDFIRSGTGLYCYAGKVHISEDEAAEIRRFVGDEYSQHGFVSLVDLPTAQIEARNPVLSPEAVRTSLFTVLLSGEYDRRGKIITRKGDRLDALTIMKQYCRRQDGSSLKDLLDYEQELTGQRYGRISLEAGYSVFVRTSEDVFVHDRHVWFDIDRIDESLDLLMKGDYLPLKGITTFAVFPECGYMWNHFLLESFCRRFSKRFWLEMITPNSRNFGVIVRRGKGWTIADILVDAIACSGIELEKDEVLEFLYCNGFIGRRSYAKVNELIERVRQMREGRG